MLNLTGDSSGPVMLFLIATLLLQFKIYYLHTIQNFLNLVKLVFFLDAELATDIESLKLAAYLNLSLAFLKLGENFEAKSSATSALKLDPENVKALFRRGQALLKLKEPKLASEDFSKCLKLDPGNTAAQTQLQICTKTLKEELAKEKKVYANMFDKFAKMDAQVKTN